MKKNMTGYPTIDRPWEKFYTKEMLEKEIPKRTIYQDLYENNKDYLGSYSLNYFGRKITYQELFENIDVVSKALMRYGIKKGDIVTIASPTLPEVIYLFYALSRIGAIANMVDPRTSKEGIEDYLNEVQSNLFFIVDVAFPKVYDIKKTTSVKDIVTISPSDSLPFGLSLGYKAKETIENFKNKDKKIKNDSINWKDFYKGGIEPGRFIYPEYEKDTPVVIVHTGGTTGKPKGVVLSNDNINAASIQAIHCGIDFKREHNWLNIMPPFIAYGIGNGLHLPLVCGMEVILIPQFNPDEFDKLMIKHKPNHMVGVPSHYGSIIKSPRMKKQDLSYVIAPTVGGDKMDEKLEEETNKFLKEHNCSYKVTKGYGLTEVNAGVAICTSNETNDIGSVGIPLPKTVISIFDPETCEELKYGELGEICITGPNTMLGYYKKEDETNKILKVHNDGKIWVHSGDLGYMTDEGKLFIIDRIKRMIIRHDGFKVFPNLIEDVIMTHPNVKTCKVVGMPDLEHSQGKLPKAYIVLKDEFVDLKVLEEEVFDLCKNKLPEYSQPVELEVKTVLPLTSIGKIDFVALENEAAEKQKSGILVKKLESNI